MNEFSNTSNYGNISITDSSNVHLGHKINYNGDVNLNLVNNSNHETKISLIQHDNDSKEVLINTGLIFGFYLFFLLLFKNIFYYSTKYVYIVLHNFTA